MNGRIRLVGFAVVATLSLMIFNWTLAANEGAVAKKIPTTLAIDRAGELLGAMSGGEVIAGPLLWSSDTAPTSQVLLKRTYPFAMPAEYALTISNLGKTMIKVLDDAGETLASIPSNESLAVTFSLSGGQSLSFSAADTGAGTTTRFVWALRKM